MSDWISDVCSSDLYAGDNVAGIERRNVATEQAWRTGNNEGQRNAASMLGLSVDETSRRMGFINTLSGEARSSAITSLSRATGRNEAQVMRALETYNASVQLGTADGATAEAGREGTSRSEEHTSELQSLMRTSYAVF